MVANEFIDNLKRDKARGVIAPHQIVLLIAFFKLYKRYNKVFFEVEEVNSEFQNVWRNNSNKFESNSNLVGMPLKALCNQGFIELEFSGQINDFRRLNELKENIKSIELGDNILELFLVEKLENILISRLSR